MSITIRHDPNSFITVSVTDQQIRLDGFTLSAAEARAAAKAISESLMNADWAGGAQTADGTWLRAELDQQGDSMTLLLTLEVAGLCATVWFGEVGARASTADWICMDLLRSSQVSEAISEELAAQEIELLFGAELPMPKRGKIC